MSSIGDIILTTPLIRVVRKRFPDASITFLVKSQFYDVIKTNPHINHIISFDKKSGLQGLRKLRQDIVKENYDLLLDIHKSLRSRYLRWFSGVQTIGSYSKQIFNRTLLVNFGINLYKEQKPVYERYFEAVSDYGLVYDGAGTEVVVPESEADIIIKSLVDDGYRYTQPLVALCPAASFTNKRWFEARYAELADYLIKKYDTTICLLGSKSDYEICERIKEQLGNKALNYAGKFSLLGSAAVLMFCKFAVTNDSGLMHLAQSQKTPVVALFGPTTRELGYFPIPEKSRVVEAQVKCRPCTHNGLDYCPKKHFKCMSQIQVADVIKAIEGLNVL